MKFSRKFSAVGALAVFTAAACCAPARAADPGDPPYQAKLERLSEILGSVHYLRNLCGAKTSVWRDKMDELLSAENPPDERRSRLVARFNRGYRTFASSYGACTDSAELALKRYTSEGEGLTREIVLRYGN